MLSGDGGIKVDSQVLNYAFVLTGFQGSGDPLSKKAVV